MPSTEMMDSPMEDDPGSPYITAGCSFMGAHHARMGIPCQDNSGCYSGANYSVAVVSDGHSDYHCFRSDVGSTIAVATTLESLRGKFDDGGIGTFLYDAQYDPEGQMDVLWKEIIIAWKMRVKEYDNTHPVTDDEMDRLREHISRRTGTSDVESVLEDVVSQPVFTRYGCTLRVAVQFPGGYMLMSLGDGETVVVGKDGRVEYPIPHDEDTHGSETHSMCDDNPFCNCRYVLGDGPVAGIAVCTDGIHCSDEPADNHYYIGEFVKRTFRSLTEPDWGQRFEDSVHSFTLEFPKDDCSVAFTVDRDIGLDIPETTAQQLSWTDDPVVFMVSERSLRGRREFGYMFNVFDENCYRGAEGMEVMQPLIEGFCDTVPAEIKGADDRAEAFIMGFRLMLQKWNRLILDHDNQNPDSPDQDLLRLTNGIQVHNRSQKYGLSVAVSVVVDGMVYSAFVGRGSMTVLVDGEEKVLEYEQSESIAHINFRNIQYSVDDASQVSVTDMDGSGACSVLVSRKPGRR